MFWAALLVLIAVVRRKAKEKQKAHVILTERKCFNTNKRFVI